MNIRTVQSTYPAQHAQVGDLSVLRALPTPQVESVGPFVFLDHFGPHAVKEGPGVSAHPHAGIEVITYLLAGAQVHRDSLGNESRVEQGGAQWITAGRGVIHAEHPEPGASIHGIQLWTSLPRALKRTEPRYVAVHASSIPTFQAGDATVRLLAGTLDGHTGPIALAQPALLAHIELPVGGQARLQTQKDFELGIYSLAGSLATLTFGEVLELTTDRAAGFLLLGGEPAEKPLLFGGPFVMDTREGLLQAKRDYLSGNMGTLDGVPY